MEAIVGRTRPRLEREAEIGDTMRLLTLLVACAVAGGPAAIPPTAAVVLHEPTHSQPRGVERAVTGGQHEATLVGQGARWNFIGGDRSPGPRWSSRDRSPRTWDFAPAPFGRGYRDPATELVAGKQAHFFRTTFQVENPAVVPRLRLSAQIADGVVAYLNGSRIWRFNISANPDRQTLANRSVRHPRRWRGTEIPTGLLRIGRNVVAVEVHDDSERRHGVWFDFVLSGLVRAPDAQPPEPTPSAVPTVDPSPTPTPVLPPEAPSPEPVTSPAASAPLPDPLASPTATTPAPEPIDATPRVMCEISDPRLPEISGLASSILHEGIVWTHNDSGDSARIFAIDVTTCAVRAVVALHGVTARDIEAIGMGRDAAGSPELWVADVGDNGLTRERVQLYRLAEPAALLDQSVPVETIQVTWTEGRRNCETLLVDPVANGDIYLISKEDVGGVYRLGGNFRADGSATTGSVIQTVGSTATDGAVAADRTLTVVRYYADALLLTGVPGVDPRVLTLPAQGQGEAVTFTPDSRYVYIASEGVTDLIRVPVAGK